jgi:hypothetical protein
VTESINLDYRKSRMAFELPIVISLRTAWADFGPQSHAESGRRLPTLERLITTSPSEQGVTTLMTPRGAQPARSNAELNKVGYTKFAELG